MTLNQMLFFNVKKHHPTSTRRWQHSWRGNCLGDGLTSVISISDTPRLSPVGFSERQGLCSTSAHNPAQAERSNMKTARNEQPLLHTFCTQLNIRARQQTEHILKFHWVIVLGGGDRTFELLFQMACFNFCGYYLFYHYIYVFNHIITL